MPRKIVGYAVLAILALIATAYWSVFWRSVQLLYLTMSDAASYVTD
jgi:hypothetical protein